MLRKMVTFQCLNFAAASFCFLWCLTWLYVRRSAPRDPRRAGAPLLSASRVPAPSPGRQDDSDADSGDGGTCPEGHEALFWPDWYYTGGATVFNVRDHAAGCPPRPALQSAAPRR